MVEKSKKEINPKEELLSTLHYPDNALFLFIKNNKTGEQTKCNKFSGLSFLPDIKEVIHYYGYETHDFNECLEIYGDLFENDEKYLPFDNNEIYITSHDKYEGCCTANGFEFKTKDWHFYFKVCDLL